MNSDIKVLVWHVHRTSVNRTIQGLEVQVKELVNFQVLVRHVLRDHGLDGMDAHVRHGSLLEHLVELLELVLELNLIGFYFVLLLLDAAILQITLDFGLQLPVGQERNRAYEHFGLLHLDLGLHDALVVVGEFQICFVLILLECACEVGLLLLLIGLLGKDAVWVD